MYIESFMSHTIDQTNSNIKQIKIMEVISSLFEVGGVGGGFEGFNMYH